MWFIANRQRPAAATQRQVSAADGQPAPIQAAVLTVLVALGVIALVLLGPAHFSSLLG